jgi:hypothetical protein
MSKNFAETAFHVILFDFIKERSLSLKISDLEAKLASIQFHSSVHSRDKEEVGLKIKTL